MNFGARGTYLNTGIPGTGLYSRTSLSAPSPASPAQSGKVTFGATVKVQDDGTLVFLDDNGQPLSDHRAILAKRQNSDTLRGYLVNACSIINNETEALGTLHCHTPRPDIPTGYVRQPFSKDEPPRPALKHLSLLSHLLGRRERIETQNTECQRRYETDLSRWKSEETAFEAQQNQEAQRFDVRLRSDLEFMHELLETNLASIIWPRETLASFEIAGAGQVVAIDVDLPEIEDLPHRSASAPLKGYKLDIRDIKGKSLQELYSRHVHSVGFRIIGEVFASLPTVNEVTLSAYTQRSVPATGQVSDTYVYSARVRRVDWAKINFSNLSALDVVAAFERFELRRRFGRDGHLESVEPLDAH